MKTKIILFSCMLIFIGFIIWDCNSDTVTAENSDAVPTKCPDLPPFLVVINGIRYACVENGDKNNEYKIIGKITDYTGDVYKLPKEDGQTNFESYLGCNYATYNDELYLYYFRWLRLEENSNY